MKKQKKSPLKDKPLRYVGQSIDEKIDILINEKAIAYAAAAIYSVLMACMDWAQYYGIISLSPKVTTVVVICIVLFCGYKVVKIKQEVTRLRLGRDGERVVGQYLELLREDGYKIFHDIIGDDFNIDHAIISEKGIFVIETKTLSKIPENDAKIYFDGNKISINTTEIKGDPLKQVSASSNWLKTILKETTGKDFQIKPVIVFPGWFVKMSESGIKNNVWVLNPRALPKFIENENNLLTKEDVNLVSFHISRYIRTTKSIFIENI